MDISTIIAQITADPSKTAAITAVASLVVAGSAVAISVVSTIIAVLSLRSQRRHNKLSVRPHVTTWTHENHEKSVFQVFLMNKGIGPAFIKKSTIIVDGALINGKGLEPIQKAVKVLFSNYQYRSEEAYVNDGFALSADEKIQLLIIQFYGERRPPKEEIEHAMNRVDIVIDYQSAYNENYSYSSKKDLLKMQTEAATK